MGTRHMAVAGHYGAAHAAFAILEAGGNAIDAGVAAGIALKRLPGKIRGGMVLVHNHAKPQRTLGAKGFRAWIAPLDETKHRQCDCGWPAMFGRAALLHYRIASANEAAEGHL
jgi:gamma-glutamyltranspeptidase